MARFIGEGIVVVVRELFKSSSQPGFLVVAWYDVHFHFADPSESSATIGREICFVVSDVIRSSRAGCLAAAAMSLLLCNIEKTCASLFVT